MPDSEQLSIARKCLSAAFDGSMDFPQIVALLRDAGFESYMVDYRRDTMAYYLPDGDSVVLEMPASAGEVAARFNADGIAAEVRAAQEKAADYSYESFSGKVKQAGCSGYIVSFPGRRVVYFGRTGEIHTEHFPR